MKPPIVMPVRRDRFSYEIPALATVSGKAACACAWHSATPGLIVVHFLANGDRDCPSDGRPCSRDLFTVTHEPSGTCVLDGLDLGPDVDPRKPFLAAAALGGLPIDWLASAPEIFEQWGQLDDEGIRILYALKGLWKERPRAKARFDAFRKGCAEKSRNFDAAIERQRRIALQGGITRRP